MSLGPTEIILVAVVLLLLFGGRKIPELMKGLGQGVREFKKASRMEEEVTGNAPLESGQRE
jgi:sec-independent protein translocase protein TatA